MPPQEVGTNLKLIVRRHWWCQSFSMFTSS